MFCSFAQRFAFFLSFFLSFSLQVQAAMTRFATVDSAMSFLVQHGADGSAVGVGADGMAVVAHATIPAISALGRAALQAGQAGQRTEGLGQEVASREVNRLERVT
jgi:hypothetical protein